MSTSRDSELPSDSLEQAVTPVAQPDGMVLARIFAQNRAKDRWPARRKLVYGGCIVALFAILGVAVAIRTWLGPGGQAPKAVASKKGASDSRSHDIADNTAIPPGDAATPPRTLRPSPDSLAEEPRNPQPSSSSRATDLEAADHAKVPGGLAPTDDVSLDPEQRAERIRIEGIRKAKELGRKPIIVTVTAAGTVDLLKGSVFTEEYGKFVLTDLDLVVNAGERLFTPPGATLEQGEYGTVKDGKVTKLEGRLGPPQETPPAHGLRRLLPDQTVVPDHNQAKDVPITSGLTLEEAYSAMRLGKLDLHIGKRVSWTILPHPKTDTYIYGTRQYDKNFMIIDGYMLVVPSDGRRTFALLVEIKGTEMAKADEQLRRVLPIIKNGTVVEGAVGGVYENKKIGADSAMPFLKDWHFSSAPAQSKGTFSVPPGYSFARGVVWDSRIYDAGVKKAKENGWRAFSLTTVAVEDGTMWLVGDPLGLQKFDGSVTFRDGDMIVAACDREIRIEGTLLHEGEFAVRRDGTFVKMEGYLGPRKSSAPASNAPPAPSPDVAKRYKWVSRTSSGIIVDMPGARNITLAVGQDGKTTQYAGLTFGQRVTVSILKDGTLVATREGMIGVDAKGDTWVSHEAQLNSERVFAFFRKSR